MFWRVSDEEKENIFRDKITSNKEEIEESLERIGRLQQEVDKLSSIRELEKHYKSLKAEKIRLRDLTKQYEKEKLFWSKRLSSQGNLKNKLSSIKQEEVTLRKNVDRLKQEIQEMKNKERDHIEMEDELKRIKGKKKSLTQEYKMLQQKAKNHKKMFRQDRLNDRLKAERQNYIELLQNFLQETTEQLCRIKQHQNVEAQPGCSLRDMPSSSLEEGELKRTAVGPKLYPDLSSVSAQAENEQQTRETLESMHSRLDAAMNEAQLCLEARTETERALQREKDDHQRLKERLTAVAASQREAVSSLSKKLSEAETRANSMENKVRQLTLQLTEKGLPLQQLEEAKRCKVKDLEVQLERETSRRSRLNNQLASLSHKNEQLESSKRVLEADLIEMRCRLEVSQREQLVEEERNKKLTSQAADLKEQIYRLREEKNERDSTLKQLQQDLLRSEASLEDCTSHRNQLEEEKDRLHKYLDGLNGQSNCLNSKLGEKEEELQQMNCIVKDLEVQLEREASCSSQLNNQLASQKFLSQRNEQLERIKRQLEADLIEMGSRKEASRREHLVKGERIKELTNQAANLEEQIYRLREEKNKRETTLRQLQREHADSSRKLSESKASLDVCTRRHNNLKEENNWLKGQSNYLNSKLNEKEEELQQMYCKVKDLEVQLEREASRSSQLNNQLDSQKFLSQRNEQLERIKRELEEDLTEMRSRMEASLKIQQVESSVPSGQLTQSFLKHSFPH